MDAKEQDKNEKLVLVAPHRTFDDSPGEKVLQVKLSDSWVEVTDSIFRSWTGDRRINGEDFHGPVYNFKDESNKVYTGFRSCGCKVCQENVEPVFKMN